MADPPFEAGFALWVALSGASRKRDARAGHSAHTASLPHNRQPSNRPRYPLAQKAILHLDAIAGLMVFSESEQSKNVAGEMVPLYAARVQDLGPDDVAVFNVARADTLRSFRRAPCYADCSSRRLTRFSIWNGGCGAGCATRG